MLTFFSWFGERINHLVKEVDSSELQVLNWGDFKKGRRANKYIVYQTEDLHHAFKLNGVYKKFLDGANQVYDYSENNLKYYKNAIHLPLKLKKNSSLTENNNNKILFYGYLSGRRRSIIKELNDFGIGVDVLGGLFGEDLYNTLKKYRFVLSIGTYDILTNDSFRVFPAIEMGNIVFLEKTEKWFDDYLIEKCSDRIIFFERETMKTDIKKYLKI